MQHENYYAVSLIVDISQVRAVPNTSGPHQQYNDSVECNNNIKHKLLFPC